ncbi:MAG: cupin domain-containing protein [Thermodesulfobacteriota bacterium]
MIVMNVNEKPDQKIETYPYKGKQYPVKDVWIRWLSQAGPKDSVEYGLRYFTIGPGGEIPIHNHLYYQTMYILSGKVRCFKHDAETDKIVEERVLGPNDFIFIPTREVHSMKNESAQEPVTFLCCIANVYEGESI